MAHPKQIIVKHGTTAKLHKRTGYAASTIRLALMDSEYVTQQKRDHIRSLALKEYGGIIVQ